MDFQTKIALKEIISFFSVNIIYNAKKFRAAMRDYCVPKIDVNLLVEIMCAPPFQSFVIENTFSVYEKKKLINVLASDYPINRDLLEEGIDSFLFAFGVIDIVYDSNEKNKNDEENKLIASVIKKMLAEI